MSEQADALAHPLLGSVAAPPQPKKVPHPVDELVGGRVQARRKQLGMSQEGLAGALGLTFQQVQKYERGKNRISASRLQHIADVLTVPVSYFFDDPAGRGPSRSAVGAPIAEVDEFLASADGLELASAFCRIHDNALRRSIVSFVERVAGERQATGSEADRNAGASAPLLTADG